MPASADTTALHALSDMLADAASVHEAAAKVADDDALRQAMTRCAARLRDLADRVRSDDGEPGSSLRLLDHLRLAVDHWFGDDDEAASTASREAMEGLRALIDDHLRDKDLSEETRMIFAEVRRCIAGGVRPVSSSAPEAGGGAGQARQGGMRDMGRRRLRVQEK